MKVVKHMAKRDQLLSERFGETRGNCTWLGMCWENLGGQQQQEHNIHGTKALVPFCTGEAEIELLQQAMLLSVDGETPDL